MVNTDKNNMKEWNSLIINHSDTNEGGASFAGFNIYKGLEKFTKYNSRLLCARKKSSEDNIEELPVNAQKDFLYNTAGKIKRKIYKHVFGGEYWSLQGENVFDHPFYKDAHVVNI